MASDRIDLVHCFSLLAVITYVEGVLENTSLLSLLLNGVALLFKAESDLIVMVLFGFIIYFAAVIPTRLWLSKRCPTFLTSLRKH